MARINLRFPDEQEARLRKAAAAAGFHSFNAFARQILLKELEHGTPALQETEAHLAADLERIHDTLQVHFAMLDCLVRLLLLRLPEPPPLVKRQAAEEAQRAYRVFLRNVAKQVAECPSTSLGLAAGKSGED